MSENENKEIDGDTLINNLKEELEKKSNQIKNLQNKLDSQDIIIADYYKIKDNSNQSKLEQLNLEKKLKSININFKKKMRN